MTESLESGANTRWFLPTLRNNAIGMITGGLVMPVSGLTKYSGDLQSLAPGRLILTSSGARPEWFDMRSRAESDTPVLLEIDLNPGADALDSVGSKVVGLIGVIPISRVVAIHFESEIGANEFLARKYENFDPAETRTSVSPQLFDNDLPSVDGLSGWLNSLSRPDRPSVEDVRASDGLAGALLMLLACPARSADELSVRAQILALLLSGPAEMSVDEIVSDALSIPEWLSDDERQDAVLLQAVVKTLSRMGPTSEVGARRVLAEMERAVHERIASDVIDRNLARVRSILNAETEIRPLTAAAGLRSAKALLLFLLRPSPIEVLSWASDMTGDPLAVSGASALCGLTCGAHPIPVTLRRKELATVVANVQAARLNRLSPHTVGDFTSGSPAQVGLESSRGRDGLVTSLYLGGAQVASVADPPDPNGT